MTALIQSYVSEKVKIITARDAWYGACLWGNLITETLRYSTRCQGIAQVYVHAHAFIRERNESYLPLPSQPKLVLIYRPRMDGRLKWTTTLSGGYRRYAIVSAVEALTMTIITFIMITKMTRQTQRRRQVTTSDLQSTNVLSRAILYGKRPLFMSVFERPPPFPNPKPLPKIGL